MINYGDLIDMVDTNNRYVYKGSVTTPPCGQSVYWNVLSKVYPVSQATVDAFKNQMGTLGVEGLK
jgi:carbonic anhydrase